MDTQFENLNELYSTKPEGYYEGSRSEMLPYIPAECSFVLEVGCGSGAFGGQIKKNRNGAIVWGIEPAKSSAALASKQLDHVVNSTFSADMAELDGKLFDVICLNDVLEHMVNPEQALIDCQKYLAPGGVIVASIPNILHFYEILKILVYQDWKYQEWGILDNTHLRFFTKKSIVRMFETCGYKIEKIEGLDPHFGLKYKIIFSLANIVTFGFLRDWKYIQFAVQARLSPIAK